MPQQSRSFCITINPLLGFQEELQAIILSGIEKRLKRGTCTGAFICTEKEGAERHAHIQLWFEKPTRRGNVCTDFTRMCARGVEGWDEAQKRVLRRGVRMAYSDWYLKYLVERDDGAKDDQEYEVLLDSPPEDTFSYYPTEEEQARMERERKSANPQIDSLIEHWYKTATPKDYDPDVGLGPWRGKPEFKSQIADMLCSISCKDDTFRIPKDQRARVELCNKVYWKLTGFPTSAYMTQKDMIEEAEEKERRRKAELGL